jgi:hypothetical protein
MRTPPATNARPAEIDPGPISGTTFADAKALEAKA